MYQAFKDMPPFLKFLTVHALACIFIFLAVVIPGVPITFEGEVMESSDLWTRGLGLPTAFIGLAMPVAGGLFLKRWRYSRQLYAGLMVSVLVAPYVIWQQLLPAVFGVITSCAIIAYLFINQKARAYFGS
ncbi:hypothetical protein SAMN03097708_00968 [Thiohalomonas denitrificans]|uniref:Uncharacterized protein n=1 Tax=Thiohalomonas denitrificans TaxID=415747 RepID=A0A1G5PYQ4_9GAMM|nr:hypothetical protein SAMN03097708_00968 [Thiohalomonas denitrificans]